MQTAGLPLGRLLQTEMADSLRSSINAHTAQLLHDGFCANYDRDSSSTVPRTPG